MSSGDPLSPEDADAQVARLMGSDAAAFLRGAYQMALGRGIDKDGQVFYGRRLDAGARRAEILWELASSEEGMGHLAGRTVMMEALARVAGRAPAPSQSVDELLALADPAFIDACVRSMSVPGIDLEARTELLARLAGGTPRYRILQDLAAASGRASFPRVAGLDELLARAGSSLFPVAGSVTEMFAYQGEAFIDCAYKTLMGRAPDAAGASHYLARLHAGYSRSSVIEGLARSTEGRIRRASVAGLRSLCWRHRIANVLPLLGLRALLLGTESDGAAARARRTLSSLARRLSAIEARLLSPRGLATGRVQDGGHDAALLARHEAMVDIQRDSFEREMNALRRMVIHLVDGADTLQPGKAPTPARRRLRQRP